MPATEVHITREELIPLWVKAVVVLCVVLSGMGAVIAFVQPGMLVKPHAQTTAAVRTYAGYLTSRNAVIAAMLLALLIKGARRSLGNLLAIVGLIQVLDAVVDCIEGRWTVAPGVLVFGILFLFAASRLCGQPAGKITSHKMVIDEVLAGTKKTDTDPLIVWVRSRKNSWPARRPTRKSAKNLSESFASSHTTPSDQPKPLSSRAVLTFG